MLYGPQKKRQESECLSPLWYSKGADAHSAFSIVLWVGNELGDRR